MSLDEQPDGDPHGECAAEIHRLQAEVAELRRRYDEEVAIVNRIWAIFGTPSYEELQGKTIYDLVQAAQDESQQVAELRESLNVAESLLGKITMDLQQEQWQDARELIQGLIIDFTKDDSPRACIARAALAARGDAR